MADGLKDLLRAAEGKGLQAGKKDRITLAGSAARRSPRRLAELAVASARGPRVPREKNGITCLLNARRAGIRTPFMQEYAREVLRLTGARSLEHARRLRLWRV